MSATTAADDSQDDTATDAVDVYERAREALTRLRSARTYDDWLEYGEGLTKARAEAMRRANTQDPKANAYRLAMGEVLREQQLDVGFDKDVRSHLLNIMDNLPAIEQWRSTLSETNRAKWNFPSTVIEHWRKHVAAASRPADHDDNAEAMRSLNRSARQPYVPLSAEQIAEGYNPDNPPENALPADEAAEVFPDVAPIEVAEGAQRQQNVRPQDNPDLELVQEFSEALTRLHRAFLACRKVTFDGPTLAYITKDREHIVKRCNQYIALLLEIRDVAESEARQAAAQAEPDPEAAPTRERPYLHGLRRPLPAAKSDPPETTHDLVTDSKGVPHRVARRKRAARATEPQPEATPDADANVTPDRSRRRRQA